MFDMPADDVSYRARGKKVFLDKAELLAAIEGVLRVKDL
jgi:hypothetical protein